LVYWIIRVRQSVRSSVSLFMRRQLIFNFFWPEIVHIWYALSLWDDVTIFQ
jgi:hypothetical protein